jgi:hypothetical protein
MAFSSSYLRQMTVELLEELNTQLQTLYSTASLDGPSFNELLASNGLARISCSAV